MSWHHIFFISSCSSLKLWKWINSNFFLLFSINFYGINVWTVTWPIYHLNMLIRKPLFRLLYHVTRRFIFAEMRYNWLLPWNVSNSFLKYPNTSPYSFWYFFPRILRHRCHDTRSIPTPLMLDSFNCIHGIGWIAANWSSDMRTRIIKLFKSTFITKKFFTPMFMGPCSMFRTKLQSSFSHCAMSGFLWLSARHAKFNSQEAFYCIYGYVIGNWVQIIFYFCSRNELELGN